jgi:hypothetical protein
MCLVTLNHWRQATIVGLLIAQSLGNEAVRTCFMSARRSGTLSGRRRGGQAHRIDHSIRVRARVLNKLFDDRPKPLHHDRFGAIHRHSVLRNGSFRKRYL